MGKYVAITIGPVFDTILLSSKPASLWVGSYMFSFLAKTICKYLTDESGHKICDESDIVTPYYDRSSDLLERDDGVGLFHDHIIFKYENDNLSLLSSAINNAIEETADAFTIDNDYLKSYLCIHTCSFDVAEDGSENIIMKCGKMLDCMELSKRFIPTEKKRELFDVLEDNERIKGIVRSIGQDNWQLFDQKGSVKDLKSIASNSATEGMKKSNYICILRADGDNMSKIIEKLSSEDACRAFSKVCLDYCSEVAERVKKFSGVTIYAGGDDLLALVPCENEKGETVFNLISSINEIFNTKFEEYIKGIGNGPVPTLSFGAFICYEKFPLYEALDQSAYLLFGVSKGEGGKNCVSVNLQKHSGQSAMICINNDALDSFNELLKQTLGKSAKKEQTFMSAGQSVTMFKTLFDVCDERNFRHLFDNTFDSSFHKEVESGFFRKTLPDFFENTVLNKRIRTIEETESKANSLASVLRIIKFYTERGDE